MTQLKTIKDINFNIPGNKTEQRLGNRYIKNTIRDEAIKWLLFLNDCRGKTDVCLDCVNKVECDCNPFTVENTYITQNDLHSVIKFIEYFFDIKEV